MTKARIVFATAVIFAAVSFAAGQKIPSFASYHAKPAKVRNINVDLKSHRTARTFRTNLRNAAKEGVNFAGHFVLTGWGCGTNCSQWAIIDARNGRVFFPEQFAGVGSGFCELPDGKLPRDTPNVDDEYAGPIYFRSDSRLVVLTGFKGGDLENDRAKCGNYFFEWTGTRLRQVAFVPGKSGDTP